MRFLYKFASRSRPQKFFNCIENIYTMTQNKDFLILATLDDNDPTMNNDVTKKSLEKYDKVKAIFGTSQNKIDAINRDMDKSGEWDVLINMSDDMSFIRAGFDTIIEEDMKKHFPDGDCLLHYPDQHQGSNCMTMSIMDRKYYERDNYIYDPRCESLWSDVIAQEKGQMRGRYKYIDNRIFNHYHPSFNDTPYDAQYKQTEAFNIRLKDYNVYLDAKKEYDPNNILKLRDI